MNKKANYINLQNKQVRKAMIAKGNFTQIDNDFMVRIIKDCGGTAYSIYMYLSSKLNNTTGVCNPSMRTIANDLAMTAKTVQKNIAKLEEAGYLGIEKSKASKNPGEQNNYYFKYPKEVLMCYGTVEEEVTIDTNREVEESKSKAPKMPTVKAINKEAIPPRPNTVKTSNPYDNIKKLTSIMSKKLDNEFGTKNYEGSFNNIHAWANKATNADNMSSKQQFVSWMAQDIEMISNGKYTIDIDSISLKLK